VWCERERINECVCERKRERNMGEREREREGRECIRCTRERKRAGVTRKRIIFH